MFKFYFTVFIATSLAVVAQDAHLHAVASEMAEHKYGTAIVVDREHPGHVVGLFTTTDALRALARLCGHA